MNVLEARKLGMRYGRRWALQDLTLDVPGGRVMALVGPNGAGKTTFLQLAMGFAEPSAGTVVAFGLSPRRDAAAFLPRVGYAAQEPPLFRRFSVGELLKMGSRLNRRWDGPLAASRLRRLGIGVDLSVASLSGGMRAQVALVLALAKMPDLIIGDLRATCDYLVVLTRGRTQLAGDMDEILCTHQRLVGPVDSIDEIGHVQEIVQVELSERQASLLVRMRGPLLDPRWESYPVDLDQIVLAYLSRNASVSSFETDLAAEAAS